MAPVGGSTGDPKDGAIAVISTGSVPSVGAQQSSGSSLLDGDKRRISRMFSWTAESPAVT